MKQLLSYTLSMIFVFLIFSCNTSEKKKAPQQDEGTQVQSVQNYSIDTSGVSIKWTAYKFTEKLGVSGIFDQFALNLKNDHGSLETLLEDAEMTINTVSVNTGNEIRDPKLRTSFFKVFHTDTIFGKILDTKEGQETLELKMNNILHNVAYTYSLKNDTLFLTTHLDLRQWNGGEALKSLNKECYEVHTGGDGISKLWPDVDVVLKFPIKMNL